MRSRCSGFRSQWPCASSRFTRISGQVLARNIVFVDLALAQIAALGATVAFMLGHPAQGSAELRVFVGLYPRRRAAAFVHASVGRPHSA